MDIAKLKPGRMLTWNRRWTLELMELNMEKEERTQYRKQGPILGRQEGTWKT